MMTYGRYSADLISILQYFIRPGDSVIDIGAQLGYLTTHLATLVGHEGSVYSFEPDPAAYTLLSTTVETNKHNWVKTFNLAASNKTGVIDFYISPTLGWSTAVAGTHLKGLVKTRVRAVRVDDILENEQIQRPIRFVKIDTEGFEIAVVDGMRELLSWRTY